MSLGRVSKTRSSRRTQKILRARPKVAAQKNFLCPTTKFDVFHARLFRSVKNAKLSSDEQVLPY
jgi:hypothetical protein